MRSKDSLNVLLVDDNPDVISCLSCSLEIFGIHVTACNDPLEVIGNYASSNYDAHVIDVWMPKMSGFDLARAIWKQNPTAQVCFLSAFEIDMSIAQELFGQVRSDCMLGKPIAATELSSHLWSHCEVEQKRTLIVE